MQCTNGTFGCRLHSAPAQGPTVSKHCEGDTDRVSLVLTEAGQVRKLKVLDVVLKESGDSSKGDDGFDANVAILTGELTQLIPDLLEALGGEMVPGVAAEPEALAA